MLRSRSKFEIVTGPTPTNTIVRWTMCDIDQDGDQDMLFHFSTQELNLNEDSTEATLTGYMEGKLFEGTDSVRIVPMPKGK